MSSGRATNGGPLRLGVLALGRGTFDLDLGRAKTEAGWEVLAELGATLFGDRSVVTGDEPLLAAIDEALGSTPIGEPGHPPLALDAIVVMQATFTDAGPYIQIANRCSTPIVVWSFPEARTGDRLRLNSLCGANLAAYSLRRRAHPAVFVHADPSDRDVADRLRVAISDVVERVDGRRRAGPSAQAEASSPRPSPHDVATARRAATELAGTAVGVVGDPPNGFEPCWARAANVRDATGVEVERVELPELFECADHVDPSRLRTARRRAISTLEIGDDVQASGFDESMRLYCGLRGLAARGGWAALSTRCWPECLTEYRGAVCTAQAMLTEDGVPAVCEADLLGSVTALILQRIAGSDPFLADLVDIDEHDNTSVLWHCGVASSRLADPGARPVGIPHPNRGCGLASQFALRPGRVTVARLSQAGSSPADDDPEIQMIVGSGVMRPRPRPFTGTCGVIEWDRPVRDVAATVFGIGLEHHLCVVYGDHRGALDALAAQWAMPIIELGAARV